MTQTGPHGNAWLPYAVLSGSCNYFVIQSKVKNNLPWINKKILNALKKRDALFRTAKSTGKSIDRSKYNQKRNLVVRMIRESKQIFFNQQLNNVDSKTFWKTVRLLNQDFSSQIPTLLDGTKTIETSLGKASTLNRFSIPVLIIISFLCWTHNSLSLQVNVRVSYYVQRSQS